MRKRNESYKSDQIGIKVLKKWPYVLTIVIVICTLCILYRNLDIRMPINYSGGDEMGVFYLIKTIKETGYYLTNPRVGGITGGDMFDYVYSDSLSFLIVKIVSLFIDNIYMIGNIFYFLNYIIVACMSLFVCRKLKICNEISIFVSVLYAFSAFIQMRYNHMWLTPYFLLPISCLIAFWISEGAFDSENEKVWKNKNFYLSIFLSFLSAFTGFYYAFFSCTIFAIAIVIRVLHIGIKNFSRVKYSFLFIFSTILGVGINALPNIFYWIQNGTNASSELVTRSIGDAETYGLKMIQLFLPRLDHRISKLQSLAVKYYENYPLVNENRTASIGIIASIGFVISLIWLFGRYEEKKKKWSLLIMGLFLVGTLGGVGSIFSLLVQTPMRCYNRLSIMIMFLCLVCIAIFLEELRKKLKKWLFVGILVLMLIFGLYDQTVDYVQPQGQSSNIESTRNFVNQIESQLKDGALIFQIPYVNWPSGGHYRLLAGYLESENLRWSFGAMQGREEALWQQSVANSGVDNIVPSLINSGYSGIYLDVPVYAQISGQDAAETVCNELTKKLHIEPLISQNGELYFWNLENYNR